VIYDASLDELLQKAWDGGRIDRAEARRLYALPLEELGALADRRRQLARAAAWDGRGNEIVTFNVDRNVNYTNVCNVYCKFCAFYRVEKDADAYVISLAEMDEKIAETLALGGTQILMQGGHHPKLTKQWYLDLLSHLKQKWPQVNIHGCSPSEFVHFRDVFNEPLEKIVGDFKAAGLGSIPGGGGEILVDRVRQRVSPLKAMSDDWLEVMDVAHRLGLYSSATMMFGHVETVEERVEHLFLIRELQEETKGFLGFIPWLYQPGHEALGLPSAGGLVYLRTLALCRIVLNGCLPNLQASWVTPGQKVGQLGLAFGANDFGSIMLEENVVAATGLHYDMGLDEMKRLIRGMGYEPRQRTTHYQTVG